MKKKTFAFLIALLTFVVGVGLARFSLPNLPNPPAVPQKKEIQVSNYRLSGPYQHENLTIYLIHGPDQSRRMFTPLEQAMQRKTVIVHETSDVNELAIENMSASEEVFVQAGDIVKGGQQDRVLAVDLIVPAKSGKMPIAAFCVENGRWTRRGAEATDHFSMSADMASTKDLKIAARREASQTMVWDEVRKAQEKLAAGVAADVRSRQSGSSLQLSLEHGKVQESASAYVSKLSSIVESSNDVLGFAFAINGKLNSADVFSSTALFRRFWPRLLKTAAIEAVAERMSDEEYELVSIAATGEFLVGCERGAETLNEITKRTHMLKREAEKGIFFETRDMDDHGVWIHRSYLTK